jgi:mono/diheme cytochrome c family protein
MGILLKMKKNFRAPISKAAFLLILGARFLFASTCPAQSEAAGIFRTVCADCHGADGRGSTPKGKAGKIHDMHAADVQSQTDVQLTEIIINGRRSSRGLNYSMPSNKGKLTDDQVKQLVRYIRGLAQQ